MTSAQVHGFLWWLAWGEADLEHWCLTAIQ